MAYGFNPQTFFTQVGVAKESAWGGAETQTVLLPATDPRFNPGAFRHIMDNALRGLASEDYDMVPGPGEGTFQWGGPAYVDSIGALLVNILGVDNVTGTYVHTFAAVAPPSHTFTWSQDVQAYRVRGGRLSQLALNFNAADGALTYSLQGMGQLYETGDAIAQPTPLTPTAVKELAGWQVSITNGSDTPNALLSGSLTLARTLKPIHGGNQTAGGIQGLRHIWAGPLSCRAQLNFEFTSTQEYLKYLAAQASATATTLLFQQAAGASLSVRMSKPGWREASPNVEDNIYTVQANVTGLYSTTDAGPCQVVLTNSVVAAY